MKVCNGHPETQDLCEMVLVYKVLCLMLGFWSTFPFVKRSPMLCIYYLNIRIYYIKVSLSNL